MLEVRKKPQGINCRSFTKYSTRLTSSSTGNEPWWILTSGNHQEPIMTRSRTKQLELENEAEGEDVDYFTDTALYHTFKSSLIEEPEILEAYHRELKIATKRMRRKLYH